MSTVVTLLTSGAVGAILAAVIPYVIESSPDYESSIEARIASSFSRRDCNVLSSARLVGALSFTGSFPTSASCTPFSV